MHKLLDLLFYSYKLVKSRVTIMHVHLRLVSILQECVWYYHTVATTINVKILHLYIQGLQYGTHAFFMLMLHEMLHAIGFSSTDFDL